MNNNMRDFTAAYEFQEYPKWVALADGSQIIVNNADEEDEALGEMTDAPADERDSLMKQAKTLGLNPHHRTGVDKLREMIATAQG